MTAHRGQPAANAGLLPRSRRQFLLECAGVAATLAIPLGAILATSHAIPTPARGMITMLSPDRMALVDRRQATVKALRNEANAQARRERVARQVARNARRQARQEERQARAARRATRR